MTRITMNRTRMLKLMSILVGAAVLPSALLAPAAFAATGAPSASTLYSPIDLTATGSDEAADLDWADGDGATGYRVYRQDDAASAPKPVGEVKQSDFHDGGLTDGQHYSYTVTALKGSAESPASASVAVTPSPVPAPQKLAAAVDGATLTLSWKGVSDATYTVLSTSAAPTQDGATPPAPTVVAEKLSATSTTVPAQPGVPLVFTVTATRDGVQSDATALAFTATDAATPPAPTGLTAAQSGAGVALTWTADASGALAGYRVYRDGTDVSGIVAAGTWTDTSATAATIVDYTLRAQSTAGQLSVASAPTRVAVQPIVAQATPTAPDLTVPDAATTPPAQGPAAEAPVAQTPAAQVAAQAPAATPTATVPTNIAPVQQLRSAASIEAAATGAFTASYSFRPASAPTVSGYTTQSGSAYSDATGSGWVRQDSLSSTHVPLDMSSNTRVRTRTTVTAAQNGIIHMQYADAGTKVAGQNQVAGAFEVAVANGVYTVSVSVGDQPTYDSKHTITVEGVPAIASFVGTAANEYAAATVQATVSDGRLTIDAVGGKNTKLNYVQIVGEPPAVAPFSAKVNFSDAGTVPPDGFLRDYGQAFGPRTGDFQGSDLSYGWVVPGTHTPLSLEGNGRNRNVSGVSVELNTFIHAQMTTGTGVKTPGAWEAAVPNGVYRVGVAVGDQSATDSTHFANVENQNVIARFKPTTAKKSLYGEVIVEVTDGLLTLTPTGGTNTKFDYITIDPVTAGTQQPAVRTSTPLNAATGVDPRSSIVCDLFLITSGVLPDTLTTQNVTLTNVVTGQLVSAAVLTSGGGDTINVSPHSQLEDDTLYKFTVTTAVTDVDGRHFLPFTSVFTTGKATAPDGPVAFTQTDSGAAKGAMYTSLVKGPDGKLYAGSITGQIYRFTINADGTLSNRETFNAVADYSASAASGDTYNPGIRTVIGLAFTPDSTATNLKLVVSDNAPFLGSYDVPDYTSRVGVLTGSNLQNYTPLVIHLPRSIKDHEVNSVAFGPDGALYFNVGANSGMGAADGSWGNRPERLLSAATLRLDPSILDSPTLPLDARTGDGGYNPYAPGAPLTIYASGIRNAFDLVWHSNGHLYAPTNGSAANANAPAVPTTLPAQCANRPDGGYYGPTGLAGITRNPVAETDYVFDVKPGRYYGHPNPARCEYILANGNPTASADPFESAAYPVGTAPDPNFNLSDVYDAGAHASADGAIEYKSSTFGGALKGKLLVVRYSSGQDIVTFDVAADGKLSNRTSGYPGLTGFQQPLDLVEDTDNGNLYVSQLTDDPAGTSIALVKPATAATPPVLEATDRMVFSAVRPSGMDTKALTLTNAGGRTITIPSGGLAISGAGASHFSVGSTASITLEPGQSTPVTVTFAPSTAGVKDAKLTVTSNAPAVTVTLRGLATTGTGGTNEPSLQRILDTWQIPVNVGDTDPSTTNLPNTQTPIGDEIKAQLFRKHYFDRPITITPLAAYGLQSKDPAIRFGWYEGMNSAARHELFTVPAANAQSLTVNPTGQTADIDPGENAIFGFYTQWPTFSDRLVYSEDPFNRAFDAGTPHHVRVYPMKEPDGTVDEHAYVVAFEEFPTTFDSNDLVFVVDNVDPAEPVSGQFANMSVANPDPVPFADQLTMSKIQAPEPDQKTATKGTVRITNSGSGPMKLSALTVTGPFSITNAPALPYTITANSSLDLTVQFTATSGARLQKGTLTATSDAATGPTGVVQLAGFWQNVNENGQEPSVYQLFRGFGMATEVPRTIVSVGEVAPVGDEVISPYWRQVDATKPVAVRQLAAYHGFGAEATVRWFPQGALASKKDITTSAGFWSQSVLPRVTNGTTSAFAGGTFTPTGGTTAGVFGFDILGERTDPALNDHSVDITAGCTEPCGQHVRMWPVKDRNGNVVPGSYVMGEDLAGINYDYQDNFYLVTNVRPASPATPAPVAASGPSNVTVSWSPDPTSAGAQFAVFRSTNPGFTASMSNLISGPNPITATSFNDTSVTAGTTYYYRVAATYPELTGVNSVSNPISVVAGTSPTNVVKVNFQPVSSSIPTGYAKDYGQAFASRTGAGQGTGLSYGWVGEQTRTPLNLSVGGSPAGNARARSTTNPDARLNTYMMMQPVDIPGWTGVETKGAWELAVPDGQYSVTVAVGDSVPSSFVETHVINIEGVQAIAPFTSTGVSGASTRNKTVTVSVLVDDGRLSVDAIGGKNTKIDYVDVSRLADPAAPVAPLPSTMVALGDSISQAVSTCEEYGDCPTNSWSTGDAAAVDSHAERLRQLGASALIVDNDAVSGSKSSELAAQAQKAVEQGADYVTVMIGANDACAPTVETMTSVAAFEANVSGALGLLSQGRPSAQILVASVPSLTRVWLLGKDDPEARAVWASAKTCQSMLYNPTGMSSAAVTRRATVEQRRVDYNAALARVCAATPNCVFDGNAVANFEMSASQISQRDHFHPNASGQAALAELTWGRSPYAGR
ncbi:SGNH/GDSL hydrolase family protein [Rathayibacter sp. YIM 133350]|uniref:SGNH/GDSL hydrolase family protein n=1 Tax=Rathayibacter sp. YIM 133350 TaxID=3131992 RepID=UPI00307E8567